MKARVLFYLMSILTNLSRVRILSKTAMAIIGPLLQMAIIGKFTLATCTKRASKRVRYLRQEAVAVSRWCIFSTAGSERV